MSYTDPLPGASDDSRFGLRPDLYDQELDRIEFQEPPMRRTRAFVHPSHEELARALDLNRISWKYKPRTFAIEWDDQGNFLDSFTPDFYLCALDLYIKLRDGASGAETGRAIRLLLREYPAVKIRLLALSDLSGLASLKPKDETPRLFPNAGSVRGLVGANDHTEPGQSFAY